MSLFYALAGWGLAAIWLSRLSGAAFGMRKVPDITRPEWNRSPATATGDARVSIIVPARNEAAEIERALTSLVGIDYPNFEIIAVDDRSSDATGAIMERVAASAGGRLRIIHVHDLPPDWLGKTHAMWLAASEATGEWLLFTDADVIFKPDALRRAILYAEHERADHVVLFPRMIMKRAGERMMIAFFQTLFVFGHRPWKVADPKAKDHMGVGAFNLIRANCYKAIGTYQRLRMEVLDDMKLGKLVKESGFAQRNVFGEDLISIRWAAGAMGVVNNLTKNFFAVLSYRWPLALISCCGLLLLNLVPFLGAAFLHGSARVGYGVALLSMFAIYLGMSRKSDIPAHYFLLHPVSTILFVYTMLRSMLLTLGRGGVTWRGTFYPIAALRRGMV
jgi:glycosyltransferase involved in cell wall biosynthesis